MRQQVGKSNCRVSRSIRMDDAVQLRRNVDSSTNEYKVTN